MLILPLFFTKSADWMAPSGKRLSFEIFWKSSALICLRNVSPVSEYSLSIDFSLKYVFTSAHTLSFFSRGEDWLRPEVAIPSNTSNKPATFFIDGCFDKNTGNEHTFYLRAAFYICYHNL